MWMLVLTVAVAGLVAVSLAVAQRASLAAAKAAEAQRIICETGNQSRAAQRQLWGLVLELSAQARPHPTPEEQQRAARFRAYIDATFAPRDCGQLLSGVPSLPTSTPSR